MIPKLEIDFRIPGISTARQMAYIIAISQAARLVFGSIRKSRMPKRIKVTVKRLNPRRPDANPTGAMNYHKGIILRVSDDAAKYPCPWYQRGHPEWPRIEMRDAGEALFLVAAHEFAHVALFAEKLSTDLRYHRYPNFEEWLCENICITSLLIRRGVVSSALL